LDSREVPAREGYGGERGTGRRGAVGGRRPDASYFALAALSTLMVLPSRAPVTVTRLPMSPFTLSKLSRS
jgi:hypothetical protein